MGKVDVGFSDYLKETNEVMGRDGILLVSRAPDGKPNAMTIGWGTAGIIWGRPVFVVLVRPSRYTYACLEKTPEFTINVQTPDMAKVAEFCGTESGRGVDKFAKLGLTALPSAHVAPALIGECAIHYECQVVHRNDVQPDELARQIITGCYPQKDFHRIYFGEILRTCIDPEKIGLLEK